MRNNIKEDLKKLTKDKIIEEYIKLTDYTDRITNEFTETKKISK